jgi:predicted nuclease of restriction endonuclease-like RecB superfamily
MLTREHAIAAYERGHVHPDRLTRKRHAHYVTFAERMLAVYRGGVGRTREELHRDVRDIFAYEKDCPVRRIEAFCKLLDEDSEFDRDRRGKAVALRRTVFRAAAAMHPLVSVADRMFECGVDDAKRQIAEKIGRPWADIDRELYGDLMQFHRLKTATTYSNGAELLARYNVAQVQVALFDAESMIVWATGDFKTVLRYAKLARLMHTIRRTGPGSYVIRFDGPTSVLRQTRRYGTSMAKFFPALVACRGWRMHAVIRTPRSGFRVALDLTAEDGLHSRVPPPAEFDSDVEATFAERWANEDRGGWTLQREAEILHSGQKVFVPDFVFRHADGRSVLMEIIGYWTPEYLQAKRETLQLFRDHPILLAISDQSIERGSDYFPNAIRYKSAIKVGDVLEQLETMGSGTATVTR